MLELRNAISLKKENFFFCLFLLVTTKFHHKLTEIKRNRRQALPIKVQQLAKTTINNQSFLSQFIDIISLLQTCYPSLQFFAHSQDSPQFCTVKVRK